MIKRKNRRRVIVAAIIMFVVFGLAVDLFLHAQTTTGTIHLPEELPTREMMAHIAANLEQLSSPNGPFTYSDRFGIMTALSYTSDSDLSMIITLDTGASPADVLGADPRWEGQRASYSDLLAYLFKSGKHLLSFVGTQGPMTMIITQDNASSISSKPLEEAMAIIQGIIGTP